MYFKKRHRTHHLHEKGKVFAWLALTTGIGNAAFWTIFPLVTDNLIGSKVLVGVFFSIVACIVLMTSLMSTVILRHFSRVGLTKMMLIGSSVFFVFYLFVNNLVQLYIVEIIRAAFMMFLGVILSLYVRDTAKAHSLGLAEGRFYTFSNIGWLAGPLIGGLLAEHVSRQSVFIFCGAMYLLSFVIFQHQHIKGHPLIVHKKEEKALYELLMNIREFFSSRERWKVFAVAFGMNYWWAILTIYIPLYIFANGFGESFVGYVIGGGIVPLILLERFVGKKADKEKLRIYLGTGFLVLAVMSVLFTMIPVITIVLALMVLVNIGAAFIEPLQETYLFRVVSAKDEEKFFGVYNTAEPIANVIAPLIGSLLLGLWGFSGLWLGSSLIFLLFLLLSVFVRK
jgi:DHA1 family multidrug resistance protein-like MFS transporter